MIQAAVAAPSTPTASLNAIFGDATFDVLLKGALTAALNIPLSSAGKTGGAHTLGDLVNVIAQSHNIELPLYAFQNWVPPWVASTLSADFGPSYNTVLVPEIRRGISLFGKTVGIIAPFFNYLLQNSLQNNPPSLLIGPSQESVLAQMASNTAFTQAANALAQSTPIGHTTSGAVQIEFTAPRNLFWSTNNAALHYTLERTSATQYTMQAWISAHFNFSLHVQGSLQSLKFLAGYTAADVMMLFEIGQVIQPFPWNTTVMNVSGNLSSGSVSLVTVGTTNPA